MVLLRNRVAIVSGAAAGIGAAICRLFREHGAHVFGFDRDPGADFIADVRDAASIGRVVDAALAAHGRIDVLVNNAGVYPRRAFLDMTEAEWDEVLDINLKGVFRCTKLVAPHMVAQGAGKIVNVSSVNFFRGGPLFTHYTASKAGIVGFTRSLAREMGPHGVHVNCVTPGAVETEAERRVAQPGEMEALVAQQCLPRRIQPLDAARVCLFLACELSDGLTGQVINVDGGRVLH